MVTMETEKLGDLFEKKPSKIPLKNNEMIVFLGMEDVSEDGKINSQHVMPFSEIKKGLTYFEKNDILVAKITPCFENSKGAFLDILQTEKGFGSTEFHVLRAKKNADPRYIFYHTQTQKFRRKLETEMTGTAGQKRVSISAVINYPLPVVHSKIEQQAISSALSDVDALITAQEQLITKKRNIKQGAMQQLLTGKKRLPGFNGEWEVKTVGEICEILKGNGLSKGKLTQSGQNKCILYGELFTTYSEVIQDVVCSTDSNEGKLSKQGDILMPGSTTTVGIDLVRASALLDKDILLGGDINILRKLGDYYYDSIFLSYYLTHVKKYEIAQLTQGITIIHLYGKSLKELTIELPSYSEQQTIATILIDMNAEIKTLERERDKYRALKQGMMQELLTGKTRLV